MLGKLTLFQKMESKSCITGIIVMTLLIYSMTPALQFKADAPCANRCTVCKQMQES